MTNGRGRQYNIILYIFLARIPHGVSHTRVQLVVATVRYVLNHVAREGSADRLLAPDSNEPPPPTVSSTAAGVLDRV